jgi:actin-related protein
VTAKAEQKAADEAAGEAARKKFEQEKAEEKAAMEAARKEVERKRVERKAAKEAAWEAARRKFEREKAEKAEQARLKKEEAEAARREFERKKAEKAEQARLKKEEAARKEVEQALAKLLSDVEASEEERQKKESASAVARLKNPEALKETAAMIEEILIEKEGAAENNAATGEIIIGRGTTTFPTSWSGITLPTGRPPVVRPPVVRPPVMRPPVMPATHHDSPVNSTEEEPTTSFFQSMQENLFEWKKIAVTTQVAREQCGPHCGLTGDVLPSDTLMPNRKKATVAIIHSFPVPDVERMLESVDEHTLLNPSINQNFQMLITGMRIRHGSSTEEAVQQVKDGTLWIDPINAVGEHDLRSDPHYKKTFDYLADDLGLRYTSSVMLKTLLEQFPNLKAIHAVGLEGFIMLELLREFFPEQITQYEHVYHPSQLHNGFATEEEVLKYLKQVILPCCDILSGKEPTPTDEISPENINLLSYVRKIAKAKSSN